MPNNKRKRKFSNGEDSPEDKKAIRGKSKRKRKHNRKQDKKYLNDMLEGNLDKDAFHEYNDLEK
jgi:hypothetical protein